MSVNTFRLVFIATNCVTRVSGSKVHVDVLREPQENSCSWSIEYDGNQTR